MLHITIIENGETKIDMDTKGIIAAIDNDETTEGVCCIHKLSASDILELFRTIDEAKANLTKEHPALKLLTLLALLADPSSENIDRLVDMLKKDEN